MSSSTGGFVPAERVGMQYVRTDRWKPGESHNKSEVTRRVPVTDVRWHLPVGLSPGMSRGRGATVKRDQGVHGLQDRIDRADHSGTLGIDNEFNTSA